MAILAAHATGWGYAELMELDLDELRSVIDLAVDIGLLLGRS